jgi:hypothetical protein
LEDLHFTAESAEYLDSLGGAAVIEGLGHARAEAVSSSAGWVV